MSGTWEVWSVHLGEGRALVVDEGAKMQARESATRRNAAAARHIPDLVFLALPAGSQPSREQAETALAERNAAEH